jgi:hypothetical protein
MRAFEVGRDLCSRRKLAFDLIVIFAFGDRLLDRFTLDIHALDGLFFGFASVLGFVFVSDTLGHAGFSLLSILFTWELETSGAAARHLEVGGGHAPA